MRLGLQRRFDVGHHGVIAQPHVVGAVDEFELDRNPAAPQRRGEELALARGDEPIGREVASPFMDDLYEATRQHVLLAVLDGEEACTRPTAGRASGPNRERFSCQERRPYTICR